MYPLLNCRRKRASDDSGRVELTSLIGLGVGARSIGMGCAAARGGRVLGAGRKAHLERSGGRCRIREPGGTIGGSEPAVGVEPAQPLRAGERHPKRRSRSRKTPARPHQGPASGSRDRDRHHESLHQTRLMIYAQDAGSRGLALRWRTLPNRRTRGKLLAVSESMERSRTSMRLNPPKSLREWVRRQRSGS